MSAENVALIRSMHPGPEFDLAPLVGDDQASDWWRDLLEHVFDPAVAGTMRLPNTEPVSYSGLVAMRDAWRDWLKHWASYRDEIEDVLDNGDQVVVLHRSHVRTEFGGAEVVHESAAIWTVCNGLVTSVDFNVPREQALSAVGGAQ
jgi:hypothetical protein